MLRRALASVDTNLPVLEMTTLRAQADDSILQERLIARLSSGFGLLALVLATVGLYGVVAYGVARRTSEIGIRMALGAGRGHVAGLVLREVLVLVLTGAALGLGASLAAGRLVSTQLYGVEPGDLTATAAATAVLVAVALSAGYLPARRAAAVNPMTALRNE